MLERIKEERVHEANMASARNTDWSHLHGEMSARSTVKADYFRHQAERSGV